MRCVWKNKADRRPTILRGQSCALVLLVSVSSMITLADAQRVTPRPSSERVRPRVLSSTLLHDPLTDAFLSSPSSSLISWVSCPSEARILGSKCGRLPVPLHHDQSDGETVSIYFEVYRHSNEGPAESAILANPGGPAVTTTGLRNVWVSLFSSNLDVHDLLLIDDRGRGRSGLLICPALQYGTGSSVDQEVADCATKIGDDDASFGTGDVALDVEAVRSALGYEKVDYYGGSYGAMDASAYATRFGEHVRSVILDSPDGPNQLIPFIQSYQDGAVPREVSLICRRSPTCSVDHPDPEKDLEWLIRTVRSKPVRGYAHDANGNLVKVNFDEVVLNSIAIGPNFGYLNVGELLAAATALKSGDNQPLLRLGADGFTPIITNWGDPSFLSTAAYAATSCVDAYPMPFEWSSPPSRRLAEYADAVAELPTNYFSPFSKAAATNVQILGDRLCVFWEEPTAPTPVIPVSATYPPVPTLAFTSDTDPVVPLELAGPAAGLFPNSSILVVKSGMHEPVESNQCAAMIASHFFETLEPGDTSCTKTVEVVWPALGTFPLFARNARPAEVDPGGHNEADALERQVVTVAVLTMLDALKRTTIGGGNGAGLRGGSFRSTFDGSNQTTTFNSCEFARDVSIDGTATWGVDRSIVADLVVNGSGTSGGSLHVTGSFEAPSRVGFFKVSGTLGGQLVNVLVPEA